jgi:glucose/arabinose dehydrogenase
VKQCAWLLIALFGWLAPSGAQTSVVSAPGAPALGSGPVRVSGYVRVIDGETIEAQIRGRRVAIGLIGIAAPQGNTACGKLATKALQQLVQGGMHLEEDQTLGFDNRRRRLYYGLTLGKSSITAELVRAGLAKATGEGREKNDLPTLENDARVAARGCVWTPPRKGTDANRADSDPVADPIANQASGNAVTPRDAVSLAGGFSVETVASGLNFPTSFAFLPDGRILIAEKQGVVKVYKNGALLTTPLLDIRDHVNDYWDHGLLSIAPDPNFATNGYLYLLYTYENDALQYNGTKTARLTRVTVSGDTAAPATETAILGTVVGATCNAFPAGTDCISSDGPSHSIGDIKFAADGTMFLTVGDSASFNVVDDNALRAQNLDLLAGKLIHITTSGAGVPSNPFWNGNASSNRSKIWAYGLRNPYRMTLRSPTNTPVMGDVGWDTYEEVNVGVAGGNYGWPCFEGPVVQPGYQPKTVCQTLYSLGSSAVKSPLVSWSHLGTSSAVTGGPFYTGTLYPVQYQGSYFYGDYSQGWIRTLRLDSSNNLAGGPYDFAYAADGPVNIQIGPDQLIYYIAINTGELRRFVSTGVDAAGPTVTGTNPLSGAPAVSLGTTVSAVFNELIDSSTLTTSTFTLTKQGSATPVTAAVAYDGNTRTATLTPQAELLAGTVYTARVVSGASGVKDLAGNAMLSDATWAFTTISVTGPPSGTTYVSDLTWTSMTNGWGSAEKDKSNGEQATGDGLALTLNGATYAKGLGVHASSDVRYNLGGTCSSFTASVGVDDEVGTKGSVVFQVLGDGVKLYDSGTMTGATATKSVNVNVSGRNELALVVTDSGDNADYDHGDWADAKVTCGSSGGDTTPPSITSTAPANGAVAVSVTSSATATFSEAIDATTISALTFTLVPQGSATPLTATVNYNALTHQATLTPSSSLVAGTVYTATIKGGISGVKDSAQNPMSADYVWTFTTELQVGTTYLSDWNWTYMANGWGSAEKDKSNGEQGTGDGRTITLNGVTYAKGLGVHAPSEIRYNLAGACQAFAADVGVDDESGANGSVIFQVLADGVNLYDSGLMTATSTTKSVGLDVTGRNELRLIVTDGGNGNAYDHADWAAARVTCGSANAKPVPSIAAPLASLRYKVGDVVAYSGSATDAEDGTIPATGLAWQVLIHHCPGGVCHTHALLSSTGSTGSFAIPDHGDDSYFEIILTATDSAGQTDSAAVSVLPQTVQLTLNSSPSGLQLVLGGDTVTTPYTRSTVIGSAHTLNAPSPQGVYSFASWSDSGTQQHDVTIGGSNVAYTATFTDPAPPVISAAQATAITQNSATITWTTNELADTQVEYGLTSSYGSTTTLNSTLTTGHSQALTGLTMNTIYHYRVKSKDAAGNLATSADLNFTTSTAPVTVTKYLSDLTWTSATNAWGPVEKDKSNGEKAAGDGKTITLNTVTFAKGLGTNAASDIRYNLAGACSVFSASVGVDDEVGTRGTVVFQVWLDGTKAYDSGTMTGTTATKAVNVSTTGKNQLQLVVTAAGDGDAYDHADWADAKITCTN